MRGKQWYCLTLQVLVNIYRLVWNYGNFSDQCHNWNIIICLVLNKNDSKVFLDNLPKDVSFQTVWVLHLLLVPINLLSLPSDSFFIAIWPRIIKRKNISLWTKNTFSQWYIVCLYKCLFHGVCCTQCPLT